MFLLEKNSARHLANQMLGGFGDPNAEDFGEMEISVLQEIGNIMTGSYLNSLSDLTGLKIFPSVPRSQLIWRERYSACLLLNLA